MIRTNAGDLSPVKICSEGKLTIVPTRERKFSEEVVSPDRESKPYDLAQEVFKEMGV